jgi:hypothetical protein
MIAKTADSKHAPSSFSKKERGEVDAKQRSYSRRAAGSHLKTRAQVSLLLVLILSSSPATLVALGSLSVAWMN